MKRLLGQPVASTIREDVGERVSALRDEGVVPTLGTVLMSDDPTHERFMGLKHRACEDLGIAPRDFRVDPEAPTDRLCRAVEGLSSNAGVHGVFVQTPLPDGVETYEVGRRIDRRKDVDCFHPENLGRLVAGDPRFVPATAAAVRELLTAYEVPTDGRDEVVVGRSNVIGKPLATVLLQDAEGGNATVTVCHSHTDDLEEKTRRADIVVTACGVPELVDGSMLSPGVVVVDVSANRLPADGTGETGSQGSQSKNGESTVVGDVDYETASEKAAAITPVPGGVGPVTLATLAMNLVRAAERLDGAP